MHYSDDTDSCKYTYIYIYIYIYIYNCTHIFLYSPNEDTCICMYIHIHTCTHYSADENLDDARRLLAQVEGHPPSRTHTRAGIVYIVIYMQAGFS